MTPDLQKEFQLLSVAAMQHLKEVPESGSHRHVFSVWVMPSFAPSIRWTVYLPTRPDRGHRPFASSTVWRSDLDWERFRSPGERLKYPKELTPTIEDGTVWLTEEVVQGFERRLRGISIPFFLGNPSVAGCDGTSYEFYYNEWVFSGSLHWWDSLPQEWRPFTEAVVQIVSDLKERKAATVSPVPSDAGKKDGGVEG